MSCFSCKTTLPAGFTACKSQIITADHFYCVSGKVNSGDKLYLVIESVKRTPSTARSRSHGSSGAAREDNS